MKDAAPGLALGVDIGGTHMRVALVDAQGKLVKAARHNLQSREPEALLDLMQKARAELGSDIPKDIPMGVGLAAQIWLQTGTVAVAPNLGWHDVPFGPMLRQRFGDGVRMINDLNAITVGEAHFGAGSASKHVVCVFVGTGVGMGAVVDGVVVEGADGLATELGHIKVASPQDGRRCGCGERGCLEAYTSGRHLPDLLAAKVAAGTPSPLFETVRGNAAELTAGRIDKAVPGDAAATALWDDVSEHLARAIGTATTLFNPGVLVLGGGVLSAAPQLKKQVWERVRHYTAVPAQKNLQISDAQLGDDAGIVGAASIARQPSISH